MEISCHFLTTNFEKVKLYMHTGFKIGTVLGRAIHIDICQRFLFLLRDGDLVEACKFLSYHYGQNGVEFNPRSEFYLEIKFKFNRVYVFLLDSRFRQFSIGIDSEKQEYNITVDMFLHLLNLACNLDELGLRKIVRREINYQHS